MSRLGKLPIELKEGTEASIADGFIIIKSSKGELRQKLDDLVKIELGDKNIVVSVANPKNKKERAFWGLYRSLINNMVEGLEEGFEKKLEVNGVGYKAQVNGKKLTLNVGYSHSVEFDFPEGITIVTEGKVITVSGIDKQLVGETSARIRKVRKPEPYKGKGIKYMDEVIRRKESKTATKSE